MELKILLLATAVIISFLATETSGDDSPHRCIHDQIAKDYPRTFIPHLGSENARAKRQADGYLPYRMAVYYVMENITNASTVISWLNDPSQGFQMAITYLQSVLSVIRADYNLTISPDCTATNSSGQCTNVSESHVCGPHATVPDQHLGVITVCDPVCREVGGNNIGVDADYIYYVTALDDEYCSNGTLAYASSCFLDADNNRPLAGFTNICPTASLQYGTQAFFMLMLHESLHALGFSSDDFENFIDEEGNQYSGTTYVTVNGAKVLAVNSSKVLSYGRDYYSCPSLAGVLLENEGGNGSAYSHWETRIISYEVMIAASAEYESDYTSISNFTLNLLEDSGWYKVDYATAESLYNYELLWGKGEGCEFVYGDCDTWAYSCPVLGATGCSYDYQAVSYCGNFTFYDGCNYFSPYSDGFCNSPGATTTNGCFPLIAPDEYGLLGACYGRECFRYGTSPKLYYAVSKPGIERRQFCLNDDGEVRTFSDGTVFTCPPVDLICSQNTPITVITDEVPPVCDDSCDTCTLPNNAAYCSTCNGSLSLLGEAPSLCVASGYPCLRGTYYSTEGCAVCAAGCRACTGPNNADCLACEDEDLYRVTTNQPTSSACLPASECDRTSVNFYGDRTCIVNESGGASSVRYHQYLLFSLLFLIVLYMEM